MKVKGLFASDIDNTLTDSSYHIPPKVQRYLNSLYTKGWELMFLTGRSFAFAQKTLAPFKMPFYLALQNGAEVIHIPEKTTVYQNFLSKEMLFPLEKIFKEHDQDFFVYSGFRKGDFAYYRPKRFSKEKLHYFKSLQALSNSPWIEVETWDQIQDTFPFIKTIGDKKSLLAIRDKLSTLKNISVVLMDDVIEPTYKILVISHEEATKGKILKKLYQKHHLNCPIIAAGDGNNDICLLENADIAIAMEDAPIHLKKMADIIAKPAKDCGIINALEIALKQIQDESNE